MAWCFGDSFDLYAATADASAGYWDSGVLTNISLQAGRFAGGQCLQSIVNSQQNILVKSSGQNDAVHHVVCAFRQTAALSGTTLGNGFTLFDGATAQCSVLFRSDGAIVLVSGGNLSSTVLATYAAAVTLQNQWFAFEIEVVVNSTTGSFTVRTNNATSNSFSATGLNTRVSANNYANKIAICNQSAVSAQQFDDFLWRSDPSSVPWVGDIRAYVRMPASDVSKQFTPLSGTTNFSQVSEAHQDGATSYVYDNNVGDNDLYSIASIPVTPAAVVACTVRGFAQRSDAGSRTGAIQLKSGGTTVNAPNGQTLSTTFAWMWGAYLNDPATGTAWTPTGVNNVQIGPVVVS